jgi:hypothetical protein
VQRPDHSPALSGKCFTAAIVSASTRFLARFAFLGLSTFVLVQCASDSAEVSSTPGAAEITPLPVRYAADRFMVAPITEDGESLLLYTDTGGGTNMIYRPAAERLGLDTTAVERGGESYELAMLPPLRKNAAIPLASSLPPFGDRFLVTGAPERSESDGFLGRTWFAGRVWVFDYPRQSLGIVATAESLPAAHPHRVSLGFQTDAAGNRTMHFPSLRIEVDGAPLDVLFDTGATVLLTDSALAQLDDGGPSARGTSFIVESVFERWRQRHPDWRVIDHADTRGDGPMIEVPQISIAGHTAGPVWFTMRPDRNFHEYMSQWMDRRIDGALGGSALRYFRVIVDYPDAVAVFEKP